MEIKHECDYHSHRHTHTHTHWISEKHKSIIHGHSAYLISLKGETLKTRHNIQTSLESNPEARKWSCTSRKAKTTLSYSLRYCAVTLSRLRLGECDYSSSLLFSSCKTLTGLIPGHTATAVQNKILSQPHFQGNASEVERETNCAVPRLSSALSWIPGNPAGNLSFSSMGALTIQNTIC